MIGLKSCFFVDGFWAEYSELITIVEVWEIPLKGLWPDTWNYS